ncbi:5521_t:CDS:2, partial [Entrophospora sp. SA101]
SNFNQVSAINISPTIPQTPAVNVQNKSHSDSSGISQAEIDSMIKSQLALVPTTSLQPTQSQKTQVLQSRQKQSDHIDYPRVPDKYMPERPPDGYAYYNEREERRHWWRVAKQLEKGMQVRINTLLLDKFALIFKLRRCQSHGRELQQKYDMRGQLWHNASLVWEDQSKLKRILEIIYKVSTHRLKQELQRCHNHGAMLEYWRDQIYDRYIKWKNKTHDDQQLILNLRGQILHLQNNPPINNPNMADDRRLPVLKLIQPALASFPPYIGQEPPDDYLDKVVQSWAFAEGHMTVLENAHAGDFDDAVKCTILKSKMAGKYAPLETNSHQLQNKSQSDNDSIRAEIKSMIKSELAVVPTTSLQPTQFQKTQALQSRQKQSDPIDYPRVPDKYMPERPPDGYGVYSEKNIHANLINPTPTSNQVIESVAKDVYEKVMDKISSFLPKKKNNTPNNDDMDEITK